MTWIELDILNLIRRCEFVATVAGSMGSVCLYTCSYFIVNSADRALKNAQRLGLNQDANKTGPGRERKSERERERQTERKTESQTDRSVYVDQLLYIIYTV